MYPAILAIISGDGLQSLENEGNWGLPPSEFNSPEEEGNKQRIKFGEPSPSSLLNSQEGISSPSCFPKVICCLFPSKNLKNSVVLVKL